MVLRSVSGFGLAFRLQLVGFVGLVGLGLLFVGFALTFVGFVGFSPLWGQPKGAQASPGRPQGGKKQTKLNGKPTKFRENQQNSMENQQKSSLDQQNQQKSMLFNENR